MDKKNIRHIDMRLCDEQERLLSTYLGSNNVRHGYVLTPELFIEIDLCAAIQALH